MLKISRKMIGTRRARLVAGAGAVLLAATGLTIGSVAGADGASAAGCYDSAATVSTTVGQYYSPSGDGWFKTTSACRDINFKINSFGISGAYVQVCFQNGGCQSSYKWVPGSSDNWPWKVIASDVKDGTKYKFRFMYNSHGLAYKVAD